MTEPLYQMDSYLREFSATVVAHDADANAVALDRSAFYPGGGGQPHDVGWLRVREESLPVKKLVRQGDQLWHVVEGNLPPVGATVTGCLDWDLRYKLMRTHTALHVLCGVVWRDYGALVTGGNMEPLKGHMDFEFESLQRELVAEIETKVNAEIEAAHPISVGILPRTEAFQIPDLIRTKINLLPESITQVRIVEIEGLDLQADGGTHVAN
ncbi:MAG: Ala-tRNA(Pro) hydrolase, partial [Chloroflexi bacterium RBG_13_56_8]